MSKLTNSAKMKDMNRGTPGPMLFTLSIMCVSIISFSFVLYYYLHPQSLGPMPFTPGGKLPDIFIVKNSLIGPVANQGDRGTCWLFDTIAILEAFYKKEALEKNSLKEDEFLKLSEQALGILITKVCLSHPEDSVCAHSPRMANTTNAGDIYQFFELANRYPKEFSTSLLPEYCCPYQYNTSQEAQMKCDNFDICRAQNPIKFKVSNVFSTANVQELLYRLINHGMPLAFETFMPQERYWFSCNTDVYKDMPSCIKHDYECPNDPGHFCIPNDFKMFKKRDTPFEFLKSLHTVPGSGHALLLVGYNRNLAIHSSLNVSNQPLQIGGLILRNSWGYRGHTLEYLAGNITADQDAAICPNPDDPFRWVPASIECLSKIGYNPDLLNECSTDAAIVRGNETIRHADLLICHNESVNHCDVNDTYVLLRESEQGPPIAAIEWSKYGVPLARVVNLKKKEIQTIDTLPFMHDYFALKLVEQPRPNANTCGYVFMPFETLDDMQRTANTAVSNRWNARGLDVKFESRSFMGSSPKFNYSWIRNSIIKRDFIQPKSLVDLDL